MEICRLAGWDFSSIFRKFYLDGFQCHHSYVFMDTLSELRLNDGVKSLLYASETCDMNLYNHAFGGRRRAKEKAGKKGERNKGKPNQTKAKMVVCKERKREARGCIF